MSGNTSGEFTFGIAIIMVAAILVSIVCVMPWSAQNHLEEIVDKGLSLTATELAESPNPERLIEDDLTGQLNNGNASVDVSNLHGKAVKDSDGKKSFHLSFDVKLSYREPAIYDAHTIHVEQTVYDSPTMKTEGWLSE